MTLVAALLLVALARLFPAHGFGLWLRLAAATLVLLAVGRAVARVVGGRTTLAATVASSVAVVAAALALTFAVHASLTLTLVLVLAAGLIAAPFRRKVADWPLPGRLWIALAGIGLGIALWSVEGALGGDAFFHLGRVRKLDDFGSLSLRAVDEFRDGGLHPGYAFPLWHGWLALVARLAGADPTQVVLHESSLLAPVALLLAYEMGVVVFRSASLGIATMLAQVAMIALAPGGGGAYTMLEQPGTVARQLLVPASITLFFVFLRSPSAGAAVLLAAAGLGLAFVHPTYALFVALPFAGFVVVRVVVARTDLRAGAGALAAFGVPVVLVFAWLAPIVRETRSHDPSAAEKARAFASYAHDLVVTSPTRYHLAPSLVDRTGAVAIASLVLVPFAVAASRRRWSALVLGGTVAVLGIELWPLVFPHFSDAVSLSQSRRASGFIPFAVALAGGAAIISRFSRTLAIAGALACGIWLQVSYAGDFGLRAEKTEPAIVVWIALYGGIAALVAGALLAWRRPNMPSPAWARPRGITAAVAVFLFVLPVAVHGFWQWTPEVKHDRDALTPGLIRFLQQDVAPRSIVFADLATSYRATAFAPVYVVAVPPTHAANTRPNQLAKRRRAVLRFFTHPSLEEPQAWRAQWLVLTRSGPVRAVERDGLQPAYEDGKFVAFRVPAGQ
jgi:hypothetical protein